jgi:CBS domain-containing protein
MLVKDLMTKSVISVKPTDTVNHVADVLSEHHFTGVPVMDEAGLLLGLISERDFIASDSKIYLPTYIKLLTEFDFIKHDERRLSPAVQNIINATAVDIMNSDPVTVSMDLDIESLANVFGTKRVNPIPVVDEQKKVLGIVSRSDLIKLFSLKHLKV